MPNLVLCLMGPTASGKTDLACELVQRFPCEIISVDSAMIYREMDIGTAKPSAQELQRAPHHLINIINPNESYSAAQFCLDANALCQSIIQREKIPLLVGGTMMYFNALQQGISTLPEADEIIRKNIEEEAEQLGWSHLHQQLTAIDPKTAARIHEHDAQRIQRALEVYYISGSTLSELLVKQKTTPQYQFINFALFPQQRSWLHERIAGRFEHMIQQGLVDEVQGILSRWQIQKNAPSMRCVGYRQVIEYLQGEYDYKTMLDKGVAATRQLAKRQLTWLRSWDEVTYLEPQSLDLQTELMAKIAKLLDNTC